MIFEGLGVQKSPIRPAGQDYEFKSLLDLHKGVGLVTIFINVQCCGGLSVMLLQLKDPLELFVKKREFLPGSGFLSDCNMT